MSSAFRKDVADISESAGDGEQADRF